MVQITERMFHVEHLEPPEHRISTDKEIMKVKIGTHIFDSENEPIMVILSDKDKQNIRDMSPTDTKYACFPDNELWNPETMVAWMSAC